MVINIIIIVRGEGCFALLCFSFLLFAVLCALLVIVCEGRND